MVTKCISGRSSKSHDPRFKEFQRGKSYLADKVCEGQINAVRGLIEENHRVTYCEDHATIVIGMTI